MDNPGYSSLEDESTLTPPTKSHESHRRSLNCSYELACHRVSTDSPEHREAISKDNQDDRWSRIDLHDDSISTDNPNTSSEYGGKQYNNCHGDIHVISKSLNTSEKLIKNNQSEASSDKSLPPPRNISVFSDTPICRICHDGDAEEELVSPCFCDGTVGLLHISCLEYWLGQSKKTRCEICNFEFLVLKKPRPWKWFLTNKALGKQRRRMIGDVFCCCMFTPLSMAITLACLIGASHYAASNKSIQSTCLILVATANLCVFILWCVFSIRRNYDICMKWRENHQVIKITYEPPEKRRSSLFSRSKNTASTRSAEMGLIRSSSRKSKEFKPGTGPIGRRKGNTMSGAFCQTIEETIHSPKHEPLWKDISRSSRSTRAGHVAQSPLQRTPWPRKKRMCSTSPPKGGHMETSTPANPAMMMMNRRKMEFCDAGTPYMPTPVCPQLRGVIREDHHGLYIVTPVIPQVHRPVRAGHDQRNDLRHPVIQNIEKSFDDGSKSYDQNPIGDKRHDVSESGV